MKINLRLLMTFILYSSFLIGQKTKGSINPIELRKENTKKNYKKDLTRKSLLTQTKEISVDEIKRSNYIVESDLYISFLKKEFKTSLMKSRTSSTAKNVGTQKASSAFKSKMNAEEKQNLNFCKLNQQACDLLSKKKPRGCPQSHCEPPWDLVNKIISPYILKMTFYNIGSKTSIGELGKPIRIKGTKLYAYPVIFKGKLKRNYKINVSRKNDARKIIQYEITERIWKP